MGSSVDGLNMTPNHLCCQQKPHATRTIYTPACPTCRKRSHNSGKSKAVADLEQSALRPACLRSGSQPLAFLLLSLQVRPIGPRCEAYVSCKRCSILLAEPIPEGVKPCMDPQAVGSGTTLGELSWLRAALCQSVYLGAEVLGRLL